MTEPITVKCHENYPYPELDSSLEKCEGCEVYHEAESHEFHEETLPCQRDILDRINKRVSEKKLEEEIANSEDLKAIEKGLIGRFGFDRQEVSEALLEVVQSARSMILGDVSRAINALVKEQIEKVVGEMSEGLIRDMFKVSIEQEVLQFASETKNVMSVQKYAKSAIDKFFEKEWHASSSNARRAADESLETCIKKLSEKKVEEAIVEIKKETIEKFNKEVMKTMMTGMAKEVGDNPNLIAMMGINE